MKPADAAIWHDVECASYRADLALWSELAGDTGDPVLDLGCGTGRVALQLAAEGYEVAALDCEPDLVRTLRERARRCTLRLDAVVADTRSFEIGRRFRLAIAPMQVAQLLGGAAGRDGMLRCVRRHLVHGGLFAIALADPFDGIEASAARPPLPDVLERDGWVYSSTPVAVYPRRDATTIERLRATVSPAGELDESLAAVRLDSVTPEELYEQARRRGFAARAQRSVPPTDDYVGSTVVVLEAA